MTQSTSLLLRLPKKRAPSVVTMIGAYHGGDTLLKVEGRAVHSAVTQGVRFVIRDPMSVSWCCPSQKITKPLWFQFQYLKSGDTSRTYPIRFLWGFREVVCIKCLVECLAYGKCLTHDASPKATGAATMTVAPWRDMWSQSWDLGSSTGVGRTGMVWSDREGIIGLVKTRARIYKVKDRQE